MAEAFIAIISYQGFLVYCMTVWVLVVIPGPTVTMLVAIALRGGMGDGFACLGGATLALIAQQILLVAGLSGLIYALQDSLWLLQISGAVYLCCVGGTQIAKARAYETQANQTQARRGLFWRGAWVQFTNPKTLLFYLAFYPQFLQDDVAASVQFGVMGAVFVIIACLQDGLYIVLASRLRKIFQSPRQQIWRERISGGVLCLAGLGMIFVQLR
ncbi:MAG: LysE family translocator [Pseudomonadota bacterium]